MGQPAGPQMNSMSSSRLRRRLDDHSLRRPRPDHPNQLPHRRLHPPVSPHGWLRRRLGAIPPQFLPSRRLPRSLRPRLLRPQTNPNPKPPRRLLFRPKPAPRSAVRRSLPPIRTRRPTSPWPNRPLRISHRRHRPPPHDLPRRRRDHAQTSRLVQMKFDCAALIDSPPRFRPIGR